jgi:hypothetical protein
MFEQLLEPFPKLGGNSPSGREFVAKASFE